MFVEQNLRRVNDSEAAASAYDGAGVARAVDAGRTPIHPRSVARLVTHCFVRLIPTAVLAIVLSPWSLVYAEGPSVRSLLEMRQSNVVMQNWDISCGAAALTTLLNYQHGEALSEKEVAVVLMNRPEYIDHPELIQIREGFSLLDLKRYVEGRGYKGIGFGKMTLDNLLAKAPILVPIRVKGYNHFVIFRGMRANRVLLADPAWGNRTMLAEQFVDSWIDFPGMGRVGLIVTRADGTVLGDTGLTPRDEDYVMLR